MQDARRGQGRPASGFRGFRGVWRSHGYGTLLDVGRDGYHLYEETAASRLLVVEAPLAELAEHFVDVRVSPRKYAFSARRAAGVTRVRFRRLARMPGGAIGVDSPGARDPVFNFEVFWRTFAERYALFELRGVDWERTYRDHRPSVCADTSAADLFAVFVSMLRPLRDGHVELRSPGGRFNAGDTFALRERLAAEVGRHADDEGVTAEIAERRERLRAIIAEDYLSVRPRRAARGLVEWGRFDAATGYLRLAAMAGHSGRVGRPRDDQRAADAAMRRAMDDLRDLPRLVVDLRGNGGGYDGVALRIAGHLVDRTRLAFRKSARKGDRYGAEQRVLIEARERERFRGELFLLTSALTASAAEIFVLALMGRPRCTRIGEATQGILSDVMERHLPNGWSVNLSNELYRAADGELYEDRGIPPQVRIPFLDREQLAAGRDPMLDRVLGD